MTNNRTKAEAITEEILGGLTEDDLSGEYAERLDDAIETALNEAVAEQEIYLSRSQAERNVLLDVQKDLKRQLAEERKAREDAELLLWVAIYHKLFPPEYPEEEWEAIINNKQVYDLGNNPDGPVLTDEVREALKKAKEGAT